MRAHRLAIAELRRLTSGPLLRLAVVALLLIPTMYAGLYLMANKDPYSNLHGVPAAIVVEDKGAKLADGSHINEGNGVAKRLKESGAFEWHQVDRQEASDGVRQERYDFALVIPAGFSEDLRSTAGNDPRPAKIEQISNDANGYLARTIANTLVSQTSTAIAKNVSKTAASSMLDGFATVRTNSGKAVDGSQKLHEGLDTIEKRSGELSKGLNTLADGSATLATGTQKVAQGNEKLSAGATQLAQGTSQLATGAAQLDSGVKQLSEKAPQLADGAARAATGLQQAATGSAQLAQGTQRYLDGIDHTAGEIKAGMRELGLSEAQINLLLRRFAPLRDGAAQINSGATELSGKLGEGARQAGALKEGAAQFGPGVQKLSNGASSMANASKQLDNGAQQLSSSSVQLASGARRAADGATNLADGAKKAADGAKALPGAVGQAAKGASDLHDGLAKGVESLPRSTPEQRQAAAEVIGNPVTIERSNLASAATYGEGMAPFFLSLALWIGAYVLFLLVRPLSHRALAAQQPAWRVALSGWMTPALLGVGQAVAAYLIAVLGLGFHVTHPVRVIPFLILVSVSFVAILHALAARFGAVGKFAGLVLLVLQLVSAGGTFPWQTLPVGLRGLHHVLPMTYAIDGVRHLMYGGPMDMLIPDVLVLLLFLGLGLASSIYAAARARVWTPSRVTPELVL
ncbi:Chromosome partition protein Smc [Austwickia sp. TVS 96-490-7B]|uniref:YhgE/Pip domain-containing protein n=1 Tax=Austwickia sp. TVS 96-490-7B TaxID=2830843 RepID=UPI001C559D0C|nr:YhgE/Pip domain-containing protein [Austwickia sp. TVS 96-490-7B]MBW3085851.1 Chromosome partition protein Smc [Austwickia sp. TVS 96-490-7B]